MAPMSDTLKYASRPAPPEGDRYLALLAQALLGYALMGKGFAYIGIRPIYVGEFVFAAGILVFLRSGAVIAACATLPSVALAVAMAWTLVRTAPFVGEYGVDALRDSVIITYGGFAFIIIALVLEDARRIATLVRYYGILLVSFPAIPVGFGITKYWVGEVPTVFGPDIPIVDIQASAVGTHLAGAAVFALVGYRKVTPIWVMIWFCTLAMIGATNRGATLAALVPVAFAMLVLGRLRLMVIMAVTAVGILGALYTAEATFTQYQEVKESADRSISAHQIVENIKSIVGQSGEQTEGTKQWRINWWNIILEDTLYGPHFWTGRGFGLNLAFADGFAGTDMSGPPLRSPHNANMTILARAGVPGVVLWAFLLLCWVAMMLKALIVAKSRGDTQWAGLFLWVLCYAASIFINATFDVTLEGPMQGIWFWCLFGLGIGSAMVYRAETASIIRRRDR